MILVACLISLALTQSLEAPQIASRLAPLKEYIWNSTEYVCAAAGPTASSATELTAIKQLCRTADQLYTTFDTNLRSYLTKSGTAYSLESNLNAFTLYIQRTLYNTPNINTIRSNIYNWYIDRMNRLNLLSYVGSGSSVRFYNGTSVFGVSSMVVSNAKPRINYDWVRQNVFNEYVVPTIGTPTIPLNPTIPTTGNLLGTSGGNTTAVTFARRLSPLKAQFWQHIDLFAIRLNNYVDSNRLRLFVRKAATYYIQWETWVKQRMSQSSNSTNLYQNIHSLWDWMRSHLLYDAYYINIAWYNWLYQQLNAIKVENFMGNVSDAKFWGNQTFGVGWVVVSMARPVSGVAAFNGDIQTL